MGFSGKKRYGTIVANIMLKQIDSGWGSGKIRSLSTKTKHKNQSSL